MTITFTELMTFSFWMTGVAILPPIPVEFTVYLPIIIMAGQ